MQNRVWYYSNVSFQNVIVLMVLYKTYGFVFSNSAIMVEFQSYNIAHNGRGYEQLGLCGC